MNKEDKELVLKDLCARLPYGVVLHHIPSGENTTLEFIGQGVIDGDIHDVIENFKPYLRPMSSMTKKEYIDFNHQMYKGKPNSDGKSYNIYEVTGLNIDWLNLHHFDYRGLIEKGLAIEAPEGMSKID